MSTSKYIIYSCCICSRYFSKDISESYIKISLRSCCDVLSHICSKRCPKHSFHKLVKFSFHLSVRRQITCRSIRHKCSQCIRSHCCTGISSIERIRETRHRVCQLRCSRIYNSQISSHIRTKLTSTRCLLSCNRRFKLTTSTRKSCSTQSFSIWSWYNRCVGRCLHCQISYRIPKFSNRVGNLFCCM